MAKYSENKVVPKFSALEKITSAGIEFIPNPRLLLSPPKKIVNLHILECMLQALGGIEVER